MARAGTPPRKQAPIHPPTPTSRGGPGRILARDRIFRFAPAVDLRRPLLAHNGEDLDPEGRLWPRAQRVLASALEKSTCGGYGTAVSHFLTFCDKNFVPLRLRYPISDGLLLAFVVSFEGKARSSTISNYVTGLSTWHRLWGLSLTRSKTVDLALRGLDKSGPPPLDLRPPVLQDDLLAIFRNLDVASSPLHAAVWACALVSWWAMCRLGETTTSSLRCSATRDVMRTGIVRRYASQDGRQVAVIRFPWTKTTRNRGIEKFVVSCDGALDPVGALDHHLLLSPVSDSAAEVTTLFSYKTPSMLGSVIPLTKETFVSVINSALLRAGRPSFTGHSFRIGGATAHWHAGVDLEHIMMIGGWKSDTVKKYLRDQDRGLLHASLAVAPPSALSLA